LTIRSRSLHEHAADERAWSEIALDDAADAEEVWLRAGRDLRRRVLRNEHASVAHDESRLVAGQQALRVAGQRVKIVDGPETQRVGGSRRAQVDDDEGRTVGGDGGHDKLVIDGRADERITGARRLQIDEKDSGVFRNGRSRDVTGDATLAVTEHLMVTADRELHARQAGSKISFVDGNATVAPQQLLRVSTDGGEVTLTPAGSAFFELSELELRCGSARVTIAGGTIAVAAPTVVARGEMGTLQLDAAGAATAGQDVRSSAVMLNEVKGFPVIFSDSPGNVKPLSADKDGGGGDDA
jgi:hypothetical protein